MRSPQILNKTQSYVSNSSRNTDDNQFLRGSNATLNVLTAKASSYSTEI